MSAAPSRLKQSEHPLGGQARRAVGAELSAAPSRLKQSEHRSV